VALKVPRVTLMLVFLLFALVVGLLDREFGRWQQCAIALGGLLVVALYFLFPYRFM
jgi:hypothetical protein